MVFHYHKPLAGMYQDNYRYGTSLYSPSVGDVERNYRTTLSRTNLRSDRGDLGMYTFAGSNLHGGTPGYEKLSTPVYSSSGVKSGGGGAYNHDLYAPINTRDYDKSYYDHLRAQSPERRSRPPKPDPYYDLPLDGSYKTIPTKISISDDLGPRKVTKKVTTTEQWVPLTTHFYHTPNHSYYYYSSPYSSYTYRTLDDHDLYSYDYVNDFKRYATTSTKTTTKNIDSLDLSVSDKSYELYSEKCHSIKSQLDEVNKWISEAESKLKSEVVSSRSRMQSELAEVALIVEDTAKYNDDLHRVIKKQAKQISQLGTQQEDINRHLVDIMDSIEKSRTRCQSLQSDLSSVETALQMTMKRRI
ncbi:uncharacterized protein [Parasteatoda tepidariorum]|nr:uncharacterized protein LOC107450477 [Parasteatoda tepidariorum]